jgi:hypothetical protein
MTGRPPPSRIDNRSSPVIIIELTTGSHNSNPDYCLLSEERNPAIQSEGTHKEVQYSVRLGPPTPTHGPLHAGGSAGVGPYLRH